MALFNLFKKTEEKACCCDSKSAEPAACCGKSVDGICCIKVLGTGCKACHEQYENVRKAVQNLDLPVEVEYITDMEEIMEYAVLSMPAIIVNDKVVTFGKVLKVAEVEKILKG